MNFRASCTMTREHMPIRAAWKRMVVVRMLEICCISSMLICFVSLSSWDSVNLTGWSSAVKDLFKKSRCRIQPPRRTRSHPVVRE